MGRAIALLVCGLVFLIGPPLGTCAQPQLPEELWAVQAQPAVFMVEAYGDISASIPKSIRANLDPLRQIFENAQKQLPPPGVPKADFLWATLADDPGKYLIPSSEHQEIFSIKNVPYVSGSAVAVGSEQGILLTNAHMVADPPDEWIRQVIAEALPGPIKGFIEELGKALGEPSGSEVAQKAVYDLANWYIGQSARSGRFTQARIVLRYGVSKYASPFLLHRPNPFDHDASNQNQPHPLTVPATVLARGEPMPGKDVAVLQIPGRHQLICLALGNSDEVTPGSFPVIALGFPGAAFNPQLMEERARYLVNAQPGIISQIRPMKGGWSAFEMTALIFHGHSGGPVLDRGGRVIGLNVGSAAESIPGRTLAVPINVAKEFLKQAQQQADPGPLTEHWITGLRLYASGEYRRAWFEFATVRKWQVRLFCPPDLEAAGLCDPFNPPTDYVHPVVQRYVDDSATKANITLTESMQLSKTLPEPPF